MAPRSIEKAGELVKDFPVREEYVTLEEPPGCCARFLKRPYPAGFFHELRGTARIGWALVVTEMAEIYFQPIATMFAGHLGKLELDAVALANTFIIVSGISIAMGLSTACDTVFSQAYGNGNYKFIGVLLQRSIIIHLLALLPCYAFHLNLGPILIGLGQDREVSRLVARYLLIFMPGMLGMFVWLVIRKYTQCQNVVTPHILISIVVHGLHIVLQYLFIYQFNWGIEGSAAAQASAYMVMCVITLIYTLRSDIHKAAWAGWDRRCLYDWGPLSWLAFFGMLMLCTEWWAFEISTLFCGVLGLTELGAQTVAFNTYGLLYGIPSGVSIAIGIRAGQHLGAGNPLAAKTAATVGMALTSCTAVVMIIVFGCARYELPKLFTEDADVINMVASIIPFVCVFVLFESITLVGRGVFRATGMQMAGSVLMLIAYYLIGIPMALPLMFLTPLGILGFWSSFSIALFVVAVVYFVWIFFKLDWQKLSTQAIERSREMTPKVRQTKVDVISEKTPLLEGSNLHQPNVPVPEVEDELTEYDITFSLVLKRVACVLLSVSILLVGVLVRIFIPDVFIEPFPMSNSTATSFTTEEVTERLLQT